MAKSLAEEQALSRGDHLGALSRSEGAPPPRSLCFSWTSLLPPTPNFTLSSSLRHS